jgi:glycosyltransferase involved in cell wall biosynthesis
LNKPTLIIFTEGHPDIDTAFIAPELNVICKNFDRIVVYPTRWENKSNHFKFGVNVSLRSDLAEFVKSISSIQKKISGVCSSLFWTSILKIKPSKYKSLLNACGYTKILAKWIEKLDFDKDSTIFYSYWLLSPVLALSRLKEKRKIKYLISRAHRFDLYNEEGDFIINFFKPCIFEKIDMLYCISENGKQYLEKRYSKYAYKFTVSRLGTFNHFKTSPVILNSLEIISCSSLSPVKRIDLLISGIENFQNKFPSVPIKWTHTGGGPRLDSLINLAGQKLRAGTFYFTGTLSVVEIFDLYATTKFSCFVNVSRSEGLPVSIMEAQSFGIPVIATNVGGTSEIVNEENGLLLASEPTPGEIASAIHDVLINKDKWDKKRILSRRNWEEKFNAETNYRIFANELLSLV